MNYYEQLQQGHYGSMELKNHQSHYLLTGLLISFLLHSTLIGIPYMLGLFTNTAEQVGQTIIKVIPNPWNPHVDHRKPMIEPRIPVTTTSEFAKPIPVDDELSPPAIDAKDPPKPIGTPIDHGFGDLPANLGGTFTGIIEADPIPGSDVFIPFEIAPKPLADFSPQPAFPDIAMRAGVSGKVTVKLFVDKLGLVKRYEIVQSKPAGLGFEEAVEKVITKWKFTPAIQQGNPVGVWISIPFNFTIKK